MEGRKVEGQLKTGLGGGALSPYLLVDASLTGTVHWRSHRNGREEVH